ncbi:betaine-aldehyde dehydrogenase [Saccharothrix sp. ALI-22-I]|uniref:aldehyde dehydrogenase family protein n=1 Tax=Saccharothrix sp. ALI-22-I TaxID=1933778 RepID=UPI00097CA208|nr:aldehyde dehydrogenase family protein [Saccharothrix sp. ALI-22-I]ONI88878.1 betaine-aldehyde dehydrogenase [Saccharothrix sp. ALI-22-I]
MPNLFVAGRWTSGTGGRQREVVNPFDQAVIAKVDEATAEDAREAVLAARRAFDTGEWPRWTPAQRAGLLRRVADLLVRNKADLARWETLDTGKTLVESEIDVDDVVSVFRYYADLAEADHTRRVEVSNPNVVSEVVHEPVGVCVLITPWNYPLLQASWKIAPALAAGNTIVVKPSEVTPLTTVKLVELIEQAGVPDGVVNLVLGAGPEVGPALTAAPEVDLVSFTGGLRTGQSIMRAAADTVKKIALELGGKNPNIVFPDADFEAAVDHALTAVFLHAGQVCSAGTRLIVHESLHDEFVAELVRRAQHIRLGNGLDPDSRSGPLVSAEHRAKVERHVAQGVAEGATLLTGGKRPDDPQLQAGFFYLPTIFGDCDRSMAIVQDETFGPILTVERFTTEDEAVALGNDTDYGLAGAVWSADRDRARRVARRLRHGTVWINDFGPYLPQAEWGGFKRSGIGRELGPTGLAEYQEAKHVYENTDPRPEHWFAEEPS